MGYRRRRHANLHNVRHNAQSPHDFFHRGRIVIGGERGTRNGDRAAAATAAERRTMIALR